MLSFQFIHITLYMSISHTYHILMLLVCSRSGQTIGMHCSFLEMSTYPSSINWT